MTSTRLDRFYDALRAGANRLDIASRDELGAALCAAGLVLREDGGDTDDTLASPPPLSFVIRHTACELSLQTPRPTHGATEVLNDAEKFRAFLAGEGPAPTDQHGGKT